MICSVWTPYYGILPRSCMIAMLIFSRVHVICHICSRHWRFSAMFAKWPLCDRQWLSAIRAANHLHTRKLVEQARGLVTTGLLRDWRIWILWIFWRFSHLATRRGRNATRCGLIKLRYHHSLISLATITLAWTMSSSHGLMMLVGCQSGPFYRQSHRF